MFITDFELAFDNEIRVRDAYRRFFRELVLDETNSSRITQTYYNGFEVGEEYCNSMEFWIGNGSCRPGGMHKDCDTDVFPAYISGRDLDPSDIGRGVYNLAKKKFPSASESKIMTICDIALYIVGHFWKYGYLWLVHVSEKKIQEYHENECCNFSIKKEAICLREYAYLVSRNKSFIRGGTYWEFELDDIVGIDGYWTYGLGYSRYIEK